MDRQKRYTDWVLKDLIKGSVITDRGVVTPIYSLVGNKGFHSSKLTYEGRYFKDVTRDEYLIQKVSELYSLSHSEKWGIMFRYYQEVKNIIDAREEQRNRLIGLLKQ
jgi:hypothetical protein